MKYLYLVARYSPMRDPRDYPWAGYPYETLFRRAMNKMKATMGLVLILIVFATLSVEAQITMSLRASWRTEVSPLDTLRQPINVPYLHVVYRNDSDTNYYLVRRDRPRWIFPYVKFWDEAQCYYLDNHDFVHDRETEALRFKVYGEAVREKKKHQVVLHSECWEVDLRDARDGYRYSTDAKLNWNLSLSSLQYILCYLMKPGTKPSSLMLWTGYHRAENFVYSVAKEPYKTDGILRLLEGRLAFLPARSEREYIYSLLAFRIVRGRFHFVIPNWVVKDTTIANEALGMEGDPNPLYNGESQLPLPKLYEGYQLYLGRVKGCSLWIEM